MAKNNKRAERMAKSDHNVNRAMILLVVGLVAEFYLLMVNNYFVKGAVGQVLTMMTVLKVLGIVGAAAFGAGLVLWIMRGKWTRFAPAAPWLLCVGFFFAVSSQLMLKIYPQGTTAMCVLVPVAMLLGIVFLLYPREFSLQALALTAAMMAMYLIHRGGGSDTWHGLVVGCSVFAALVIAALAVAVSRRARTTASSKSSATFASCRRAATTSSSTRCSPCVSRPSWSRCLRPALPTTGCGSLRSAPSSLRCTTPSR